MTLNTDLKVVPNLMVSNPTIKNVGPDTVLFASGTLGVRKIIATGKRFESVSFLPYPGYEEKAGKASDGAVAALLDRFNQARASRDDAAMLAAVGGFEALGVTTADGINGVYNMFDRDGYHYCVYGGTKVLKTTDDNVVSGPVRVVKSADVAKAMPAAAAKAVSRIIGLNMTYDGFIVAAAPGALVVLDRDLNVKSFITFANEAVDNSIAIDEKNGIYVVTSRRMLKVIWNGTSLSTDEKDGAWESGYEWTPDEKALAAGAISRGSGTTPTLVGFGDDPDKLVVIADAAESGTNAVAFWRDAIPADFKQKPGTKSRRIADQTRIEISQLTIEPSPNALGYGVTFINGSYPQPVKTPGAPNAFTAGVTRPAPKGVQKFNWNPQTHQFDTAWINRDVDNSDIMVPVVSAATGLLYCAHKENGDYQYVGLDWQTGELRERWIFPDQSRIWNAFGGITTVMADGDLLIGGAFGVKRIFAS
ncbi:hypothetical protein [Pandoraea pneumonica]|uniref:hypothetical protein n=1 Tax=Pandoraea pneumonica TaxID=2508299 RepID=UPI001C2D96A4|nr:hypothetical protein [Pandoraea pneumonica]